jgi:hypothetical protein
MTNQNGKCQYFITIHYRKSTIFQRPQLFSVDWTVAAGNKVIFGGSCRPPKMVPNFHRPIYAAENWPTKPLMVIGLLKIQLLSTVFRHRAGCQT